MPDGPSLERVQAQLKTAQDQLAICQADRAKYNTLLLERDQEILKLTVAVAVAQSRPLDENVAWLTMNRPVPRATRRE